MGGVREEDRRRAVERFLRGEGPAAICVSMGYSLRWFYKWLGRHGAGSPGWYLEASRRPHHIARQSGPELEGIVRTIRLSLDQEGAFCGAQAIRWEMEALAIRPLASVRTISRILLRQQLTRRRVGPYQPKGKRYPAPIARHPGAVHQSDFVGPCYLQGALRFYSLNSVDLSTARCAVQPLVSRGAQGTIDAFWSSWSRLGLPQHQQVDNELVFYGSPAHPRGMGSLIRLCLTQDIEVWFIPPGEPWRNGVVEKFNDHWRQKLLGRIRMKAFEDVQRESIAFEQRHNSRYRYSKLGGKTPTGALAASAGKLCFPASFPPPRHPLPKPQSGRYHLIRFIRSDGLLDVFGEKFKAPPETAYEYIQATVEVQRQRLQVRLDGVLIDEHKYGLR